MKKQDLKLQAYQNYIEQNACGYDEYNCERFDTVEKAVECARLRQEWWGSNLVLLGIANDDIGYYMEYNLFD